LLITVDEAAEQLSVGRSTVYKLASDGKLQLKKIGRATRVVVASMEAFVEAQK
jgi:excisionase family DNA binding protein